LIGQDDSGRQSRGRVLGASIMTLLVDADPQARATFISYFFSKEILDPPEVQYLLYNISVVTGGGFAGAE
jgi:hypothetical protein